MNINRMAISIFMFFLSTFCGLAHQDLKLNFAKDKIIGLPEKYEPCFFVYDKNQISIGGKVLKLPTFLDGVLNSGKAVDKNGDMIFEVGVHWRLSVTASWFHDKSEEGSLPDYMILGFYPENKDFYFNVYLRLENPAIVGSKVILTTYSQEKGDKLVDSKKVNKDLSSTQMELIIGENSDLDWGQKEGADPASK